MKGEPLQTIEMLTQENIMGMLSMTATDKSHAQFNYYKYPDLKEKIKTAKGSEWIPSFDICYHYKIKNVEPQIIKSTKVKNIKTNNQKTLTITTKIENAEEPLPEVEFPEISIKTETKENAKAALENQERKQRLKESRIAKQPLLMETSSTPVTLTNEGSPKVYLSPSCMKIFDKLWELNSGALNVSMVAPFDPHDYHNDIDITRCEVKKLIEGLGGKYSEDGGKGSHEKGILNSPKFSFGEKSTTFADFNSVTSQNVILPKSNKLKFYQVFQLRDKLIKLGFTPESVSLSPCDQEIVIPD
jgi:hypothetical protein